MFGLFKKQVSIEELAKSAEILSVAENGDYKAFLVRVLDKTETLSASLKAGGGQVALERFVEIIERRILTKDFDDIFSGVDQMHGEFGATPKRNTNVERILICADKDGYIFRWTP
jgi:hypothetical protein